MFSRKKSDLLKFVSIGILTLFTTNVSYAASVDGIISTGKQTAKQSAKAQKDIDRLADATRTDLTTYEQVLNEIEQVREYNEQIEKFIIGQQEQMTSLQEQMETIDVTEKGVIPLMNEMIDALEKFIEYDLPFRLETRLEKVGKLRNLMISPKVSNGERYRRILVAYQEELNYGSKFVTYSGDLPVEGEEIEVDFLHVGRVLLVFLTLDGSEAGYFNRETGNFEYLDSEYIQSIRSAIKIARNQASPDLIKLPIPAAQGVN